MSFFFFYVKHVGSVSRGSIDHIFRLSTDENIFSLFRMSSPAVISVPPPVQGILGLKRPGREPGHKLSCSDKWSGAPPDKQHRKPS